MNYVNCRGCIVDHETCVFRKMLRDRLLGTGVTSVRFKCAARKPKFSPGDRVRVTWPFYEQDEEYPEDVTFLATVIREHRPGRYQIRVDPGLSYSHGEEWADKTAENLKSRGYAIVSMTRLESHDEQSRVVCQHCARVEGITDNCEGRTTYFRPVHCIAPPRQLYQTRDA